TAWPVDDVAARLFARHIYAGLLGLCVTSDPGLRITGRRQPLPMYRAMQEARLAIAECSSGAATWGAYQHYGKPHFRFFDRLSLNGQAPAQATRQAAAAAPSSGSTNGNKPSSADKPPSEGTSAPSQASFADVQRVIARRDTELRRLPNVIDV